MTNRRQLQAIRPAASSAVNGDGFTIIGHDLVITDADKQESARLGHDGVLTVGGEGSDGHVVVRDETGANRIVLDGSAGDIRLLGADLAEDFDTSAGIAPGSVVVAVGPDEVAESATACDRRVVGVVSGAADLQPALRLASRPGVHRTPVALVGRVYCQVDARPGPIAIGDLLASSDTPGHAMRIDGAAPGTIIGKALAPLTAGTGLVPVLLMLR